MKNPLVVTGLAVSLVLAGGVSYYASSHPDGLEKVAGDIGFLSSSKDSAVADSPLADYEVAGIENERIKGGLAGVIGVASTAAVSFGLFYALRRFKKDTL
jgi:hypothetical protein